ncbi:DUF5681 domain-containing protein [Sphingomonas sp. BK345]|uniref:DUF5681 domain-containing protein n=1 Tax=Sphingomonas sp. BK345 TaxID=2586980 RepID=UPI00161BEFAD|nr:DUF5681 domain-containing protein [Sphingomonas sp. BK345]MBB3474269.1 hypothetical protein [Sphingomonas sp. BK345]
MSPHDHLPPARHRVRPVPKPVSPPPPEPPASAPRQADYDIGYGKPPKHSQFQKGQSGNPKGRAKGSKNLNTLVRELLDERIPINTPSGRRHVARIEVLLRKLIEVAAKGNTKAMEQLLRQYALAQAAVAAQTAAEDAPTQDVSEADAASLALLRELMLAELQPGEGGTS